MNPKKRQVQTIRNKRVLASATHTCAARTCVFRLNNTENKALRVSNLPLIAASILLSSSHPNYEET